MVLSRSLNRKAKDLLVLPFQFAGSLIKKLPHVVEHFAALRLVSYAIPNALH